MFCIFTSLRINTNVKPEKRSRYSEGLLAGSPGFDSLHGQDISFSTPQCPELPAKPPIQCVPGALSRRVKR
jgi:hypothetical protein